MKSVAIVPAAGRSRRMGTPKLALPLGSRSVLEHVIDALNSLRLDAVLVVLGVDTSHLASLVHPPAETLVLTQNTPDMRTTLELGLDHLDSRFAFASQDAILVALGDQPTIQKEIAADLLQRNKENPGFIRIPSHSGRRGHPILLPYGIIKELRSLPADVGLNALVDLRCEQVAELVTDSADILEDMDDPAAYRKLGSRMWK